MYLTCALCALALLNGAAAYQSSGSQAFGLVRKASNETVTTRTSASSTSVSPCTTTITSILGEKFVGVEESCWTVTVVSRPEMQSKSTSPVDSSSKLTSSSPPTTSTSTTTRPTTSATSNPPNTSLNCASADPVWSSSSTSTPHAVQTSSEKALTSSIAQNNGQTSLESTVSLGGSGGTGGNFVQSTTGASQAATTTIPPTLTDVQSTTQRSPILSSTTSADTHPTTLTSQTGIIISNSQSPTQTSRSQLLASSSVATTISNSASTQINQSISQVETASQQSSSLVVQSNSPSGTASGSILASQQSSPTSSQASNTNTASASGASTTPTTTTYAPILYGSQTISRDGSSNFIFGSQTLTPGSAITISGEVISAGTGGAIIINAVPPQTTSSSSPPAVIVVGGTSITANSNSDFVIGSQTLTPGGAVTESGQVITLPSASSTPTQTGSGGVSKTTGENTLVTSTLSLGQQGSITSVLIGGQTLTAGGRVTVGGDVLSLASGGGNSGIMVVSTVTVTGAAPSTAKKSAACQSALQSGLAGVMLVVLAAFWGLY